MAVAEIIAVGSELLTPDKTDTNSLWLTAKLNEIGVEVKLKTVVGDDHLRLEEAVRDAFSRSEVVITTGGLGPTEDDITRSTAAAAVGRDLVFREELLEELRAKFKSFGYEMPERNRQQAYLIDGADVLPNPNGSAVGMIYKKDLKILALLPGPPREMKPMFEKFVLPEVSAIAGGNVILRRSLRVTGLGESRLDELIAPIYTKYENPATSTLFSKTDIEVQFTANAETVEKAETLISAVLEEVNAKLGDSVFSKDNESMETVVGRMLTERGMTLSTAESCTGGLVSMRLTDIPGSSAFFVEGCVTYSNDAKIRTLNVTKEVIGEHGAVSAEVAEAMALGLRHRTGSDIAVSITGIAGPDGGTEEKPVGTVFIGLSDKDTCFSKLLHLPGDRNLIRWRSSQAALDLVRKRLMNSF